ncbi:MAG: hypothetical protein ABSA41_06180 [Terriglobia bacterium]
MDSRLRGNDTVKSLAARMAPNDESARLMRRMEDFNFRQVWRVTNLLLKIKRQAREEEGWEMRQRSLNVDEKTAG